MLPTVGSKSLGEEAGVDNGAVRGSEASKGPEDRPYQECTRGGRGRCRATSGRGAGDEVVAAAHGAGAGRRRGAEDDEVGARTSRMRLGWRGRASRMRGRGDDVDLKIVICGREGKGICWGVLG